VISINDNGSNGNSVSVTDNYSKVVLTPAQINAMLNPPRKATPVNQLNSNSNNGPEVISINNNGSNDNSVKMTDNYSKAR